MTTKIKTIFRISWGCISKFPYPSWSSIIKIIIIKNLNQQIKYISMSFKAIKSILVKLIQGYSKQVNRYQWCNLWIKKKMNEGSSKMERRIYNILPVSIVFAISLCGMITEQHLYYIYNSLSSCLREDMIINLSISNYYY